MIFAHAHNSDSTWFELYSVAMGFGNLKTEAGLANLNKYLQDRSYIEGYVPSQADVAVFKCLEGPPASKFHHALRWYNHIASYSAEEHLAFPGVQKPIEQYGPEEAATNGGGGGGEDEEEDFDLFGSEDEEEVDKLKQKRLDEYAEKKKKKPGPIAKSNIILEVKPWGDDVDMAEVEKMVRSIEADGLLWGAAKLVPIAFGIKKLQISCVVEDEKIGTDFLEESITAFEDHVQSVDIAAFNKI